jgi:hypothetical protein
MLSLALRTPPPKTAIKEPQGNYRAGPAFSLVLTTEVSKLRQLRRFLRREWRAKWQQQLARKAVASFFKGGGAYRRTRPTSLDSSMGHL